MAFSSLDIVPQASGTGFRFQGSGAEREGWQFLASGLRVSHFKKTLENASQALAVAFSSLDIGAQLAMLSQLALWFLSFLFSGTPFTLFTPHPTPYTR